MITHESIIRIGQLTKPHGIKGEVTATLDYDLDLLELSCVVIEIDGIYVPFFVSSVRPKSVETVILKIDDIDDEHEAKEICGHDYYALRKDVDIEATLDENGGFLSDFIGFELRNETGNRLGEITGYDDSTENLLFELSMAGNKKTYIPVADDLIEHIDPERRILTMRLPEGLFDL